MKEKTTFGIDELRKAVKMLDACNETFNQQFSAVELLRLAKAQQASAWCFFPDEWSDRQVSEALEGIIPAWNDDETPNYDERKLL